MHFLTFSQLRQVFEGQTNGLKQLKARRLCKRAVGFRYWLDGSTQLDSAHLISAIDGRTIRAHILGSLFGMSLMDSNGSGRSKIQGLAKRRSPGLVNFVDAVAYHFSLSLPAAFTQPGAHLSAEPFTPTISRWIAHRNPCQVPGRREGA